MEFSYIHKIEWIVQWTPTVLSLQFNNYQDFAKIVIFISFYLLSFLFVLL